MKTIDRYILRKTLWPLTAAIAIALAALLLERLVRLFDLFVGQGGPIFLILKMVANLIPHYLGIALPAAFFVGVLLAAMRLSADSELDAMHSFGVGLQRLLLPTLGLAVVLMVCSSIVIGFLQPYTRYTYRALVYSVTHAAWNAALERGTFFSGFGGMTIMVDDLSEGGRRLSGIFLHETRQGERAVTTTAEQGRLFRSRDGSRLIMHLESGVLAEGGRTDGNAVVLTFERFDLPLDLAFGAEPFRKRGEGERELTLFELWQLRKEAPPGTSETEIASEFHARLVRIVSLLFLPLLAIPLGIASRRSRRGIGLAVGLVLVVVYHHVLQFGESLADAALLSPWLGLWLPLALFAGASGWAFYAATARPDHNPFRLLAERLERLAFGLRVLALRQRKVS